MSIYKPAFAILDENTRRVLAIAYTIEAGAFSADWPNCEIRLANSHDMADSTVLVWEGAAELARDK